jgi:chromate reductase
MSQPRTIAVLVGSLRKDSASRKIAKAIAALSPPGFHYDIVEIGQLPLFDQDLEGEPPKAWVEFRDRIRPADAVLFVTPEYNRSVPGALKNAVDVASRPYGQSVFTGKPAAIVSTSVGPLGGFGANHHLRQSLSFLSMPILGQPETYIGNSLSLFDEAGALVNDATAEFLRGFATVFAQWIERHAPAEETRTAALGWCWSSAPVAGGSTRRMRSESGAVRIEQTSPSGRKSSSTSPPRSRLTPVCSKREPNP